MQLSELKDFRKVGMQVSYLPSAISRFTTFVPGMWNELSARFSFASRNKPPEKNILMRNQPFPGFDHPAEKLSAYAESHDFFVICHENLDITSFTPHDKDDFRTWLKSNGVRDINGPEWIKCQYPLL